MFDIDKNGGYNIAQVDKYIVDVEQQLLQLKIAQMQVEELKKQLQVAQHSMLRYKQNNENYAKTVLNAVSKSEEVEQLTLAKYQMELKQLRAFHNKWLAYYDKIISIYPVDSVLKRMEDFNTRMNVALNIDKAPAGRGSLDSEPSAPLVNQNASSLVLCDMLVAKSNENESNAMQSQGGSQPIDYKEALTPKQSLVEILKDLGIKK